MMHITMWSQFVRGCFWPLPRDRCLRDLPHLLLFLSLLFGCLIVLPYEIGEKMYSCCLGFLYSGYCYWLFLSINNQAVEEFYHLMMKRTYSCSPLTSLISRSSRFLAGRNLLAFDDGAVVVITEADLDGYDQSLHSRVDGSEIWADLNLIYRVRVAGGAALTRLSCMWFRCHDQKIPTQKLTAESKQVGSFTVDIHVFS